MSSIYPSRKLYIGSLVGSLVISYPFLKEFTSIAHKLPADNNRPDRTAIVTGATGDLGSAIVDSFAKRQMRVIMACRDMDKCKSIRREIVLASKNKSVVCRHLDLESIDSINRFVKQMNEEEPHIDILVNAAGTKKLKEKQLTKYGVEKHFFVNFLAPSLLTLQLQQKLEESAAVTLDSRVINITGIPRKNWNIYPSDINFDERKYSNDEALRQSKLALAYFTVFFDKLNRKKKNHVYAFAFGPATKLIDKPFPKPANSRELLAQYVSEMYKHNIHNIVLPVDRLALAKSLLKDGSGKLYGSFLTTLRGWRKPSLKDEDKAKLLWNLATELLLKLPDDDQDQLKQEKSKASVEESA